MSESTTTHPRGYRRRSKRKPRRKREKCCASDEIAFWIAGKRYHYLRKCIGAGRNEVPLIDADTGQWVKARICKKHVKPFTSGSD